jgi:16S rRNA (guanine527-N7)-methyltransferase
MNRGPAASQPAPKKIDPDARPTLDLRIAQGVAMPEACGVMLKEMGIELEAEEIDKLGRYVGMLLLANTVTNLTAIVEPEEAWRRHVVDALTLLPLMQEITDSFNARLQAEPPAETVVDGRVLKMIDVGSGGGVPGVPLAIVMNRTWNEGRGCSWTLMEPIGKKARILEQMAWALDLTHVKVLEMRAEAAGQDRARYREKFDGVVARAVGPLNVLIELTVPLCKQGGLVLAMKGIKADAESQHASKAIGELGARQAGIVETAMGKVVVLEKASKTPNVYPRRDGEPKARPLGGRMEEGKMEEGKKKDGRACDEDKSED